MKMKRLYIIIVYLLGGLNAHAQLDAPTSQYFFNQAVFNPAYTGIYGVTSFNFQSRLQWVGIDGAPLTNILNAHTSFLNDKVGAGVLLINDRYGVNSNNEVHLTYSYKLDLKGTILSFGLQTGIVNFSYDYDKLNMEAPDPNFMPINESFTRPNFGAGIFVMDDNYFFGFSVPKFQNLIINNGTVNSVRYRRHFYISGGYLFDQIFAFKLKPSFVLRTVDGGFTSVDINVSALLNERIWVGVSMRDFGNAFGINGILEINERFRAGMSGEVSSGTFTGGNFGTYEIMLGMDIGAVGSRYF